MAPKCLVESHIPFIYSSLGGSSKCIQAIMYVLSASDRPWNPCTKEQAQKNIVYR